MAHTTSIDLPSTQPSWWEDMTDAQQWLYFRKAHNDLVLLRNVLKEKTDDSEILVKLVKENTKFLKNYTPFYPKFAFSFGASAGLDKLLTCDLLFLADFYIYFFKGRIFLNPGLSIKMYENAGGGLNFSVGVVF